MLHQRHSHKPQHPCNNYKNPCSNTNHTSRCFGNHLQQRWLIFFAHAQKRHNFYFRSEICCHCRCHFSVTTVGSNYDLCQTRLHRSTFSVKSKALGQSLTVAPSVQPGLKCGTIFLMRSTRETESRLFIVALPTIWLTAAVSKVCNINYYIIIFSSLHDFCNILAVPSVQAENTLDILDTTTSQHLLEQTHSPAAEVKCIRLKFKMSLALLDVDVTHPSAVTRHSS